jgi:hypothetical protein
MSVAYLLAGFDTARIGSLALHYDDGDDTGVVTLAAGTYAHRNLSSVMGAGNYTDLRTAVYDALTAFAINNGPPLVFFDIATQRYRFQLQDATEVIDFRRATIGSAAGNRLAAALGFNYQNASAAGGSASDPYDIVLNHDPAPVGGSSYVSNVTPTYYLALARDGVSGYTRPYETSGQTKRGVSSKGNAYSIEPHTYEKRAKFRIRFMELASVFADDAALSAPWTYEHLVQHARAREPLLLSYPAEDLVYKLVNADFDQDARSPVWNDYHGKWDLSVEAQVLGRL